MATHDQPAKIGKYEILSTLGRGGMGVVYKARDPIIDRIVAVKTILVGADAGEENLLDRLHMEARSAGRLHHPNIVTVFDFGQQDDLSYIVMEYVEGINLARLIDERRPLGLDTKINILIQIADGLAYAHEHGVVHRDMKPSNVCITARGTPKILDFGLARFDNTRLTKTGYMAGTIAYMSPERLNGETGPKDDIFALGAIAYELVTNQRAFAGTMPPEVISKIISPTRPTDPSQIAGVPAELDAVIQKALAKDIDQRYESAAAFADDLRLFMRSDSLREYIGSTQRPTIDKALQEFVDHRPSANPYVGSSGKTAAGPPVPTLQVSTEKATVIQTASGAPTAIVSDVKTTGARTDPEVGVTQMSAAPTQIVSTARPRRGWAAIIAAAALLGVLLGAALVLRRSKPVSKPAPPVQTVSTTQSTTPNPLAEKSELQLATARTLSDELAHRRLSGEEVLRFSEAKARIELAEKKLNEKDYDSGARLISAAIADLQAVMTMSDRRMQKSQVTVTAPPVSKKPKEPPPQPQPQTTSAAPRPVPAPVEPQPVPQPQHVEPAPRVAVESPEKQIASFMRQLAAAYQAKDVAFFREHALHFNDQLASAIRNSPSVRVELQVERIEVRDPQHATVFIKRTDWFPDNGIPPAVQSLAYNLEHSGGGWQLASIARR